MVVSKLNIPRSTYRQIASTEPCRIGPDSSCLDKAEGRTLGRSPDIDGILPCEGRDHQQGLPRTDIATPVLDCAFRRCFRGSTVTSSESWSSVTLDWFTIGPITWSYSRRSRVQNDDGGFLPLVGLFQRVDRVHEEDLFIQRIGVARMAVLDRRALHEAHRRYVVCFNGIPKVCDVVFVFAASPWWPIIATEVPRVCVAFSVDCQYWKIMRAWSRLS